MFQVLEHLENPLEFLKQIKKYLKSSGIIYIEVPNLRDALIHAYNLPHHYKFYFHKTHLWYFTKQSLMKMMGKAGFKGRIFFTQDYNILNHMHWLDCDSPQTDCIKGLSVPLLPFRNTMELAKKARLSKFMRKIDLEYKKILTKLEIASNISFIGKKIA